MKITLNRKWRIGGWTQIASLIGGGAGEAASTGVASQFASGAASGATGAAPVGGAIPTAAQIASNAATANAPAQSGFAQLLQNVGSTGSFTQDAQQLNRIGPAPMPDMQDPQTMSWLRLLMGS